jgi:hypothetical protein
MLHACVERFDVMCVREIFWVGRGSERGLDQYPRTEGGSMMMIRGASGIDDDDQRS